MYVSVPVTTLVVIDTNQIKCHTELNEKTPSAVGNTLVLPCHSEELHIPPQPTV